MRIAIAGILIVLGATTAPAQLSTSTVRGHVSDPSGAAVVGAPIKLVNLQTSIARDVVTNGDGDYEIPDLQHGSYRLTVTQAGFKTYVADNIVLETTQIRRIERHTRTRSRGK